MYQYSENMTQVSRIKLRVDVEDRIYNLLSQVLAGIKKKEDFDEFLDDFLSPTERTVFAKRLAIAVLLAKDCDYAEIRETLRVTPVTISKVSFRINHGNSSIKKVANDIADSDSGKALVEEILGFFGRKRRTLTGEVYRKPFVEKEKRLHKLKKEI